MAEQQKQQLTPELAKMLEANPELAKMLATSAGYVNTFPAPGLRRSVRHITGHNAEGKGVFIKTDCGDHHRVIGNDQALANIIYSTKETPVEMNGDVDLKFALETEVSIHLTRFVSLLAPGLTFAASSALPQRLCLPHD